jgi:hypothetical protein
MPLTTCFLGCSTFCKAGLDVDEDNIARQMFSALRGKTEQNTKIYNMRHKEEIKNTVESTLKNRRKK